MNIIRGGNRIPKEACDTKEWFDVLFPVFSEQNRQVVESNRKTSELLFQCGTELTGEEQERCFEYANLAAERMDKAATDGQVKVLIGVSAGFWLMALASWGYNQIVSNCKRLSN